MKPFLLGFFQQNQLFWIVGRDFISGRWVTELVWRGSYKSHYNDSRCAGEAQSETSRPRVTVAFMRARTMHNPRIALTL
jgi:hypothetical protein